MKNLFFPFVLLLAASVVFTGCRSDDDPTDPEYIVVENPDLLEQNVYADEDADESGVRITTFAPWRSEITDVTSRTNTATRNTADWVSISPESGGIGTYTIVINLEPNFSGNDRSAVIAIISGGTTIRISITQQGVTEEGEVPEDHSIIRAENIIGDVNEVATIRAITWNIDRSFILGEASFQINGFTMQLTSDVPESSLLPLVENSDFITSGGSIVLSDRNAKVTHLWSFPAFDRNNNRIGYFYLANRISEEEGYRVSWLYIDRDATIRGSHREEWEETSMNLDLRRGWNIIYEHNYWNPNTGISRSASTTQRPSGANLRWRFAKTPPPPVPDFVVKNPTALQQTIDRNGTTGESIRFTAGTRWTSSIRVQYLSIRSSAANWISITPTNGEAGNHEITFTLEPNTTYHRAAIITITSGASSFDIHITQRGIGYRPAQTPIL